MGYADILEGMSRLFNEILIAAERGEKQYSIGRNKIKILDVKCEDQDLEFEFSGIPDGHQNCSVWKTGSDPYLLYAGQKTIYGYRELIFPSIERSHLWRNRLKEIVHRTIVEKILGD